MATSYNGWTASPDKAAINVQQFGDKQGFPFPGGVKGGDVFTVLGYVMTQLHHRVEPCIGGWCWGYTYKANVNNPSQLSCHASGTACDWNAPNHPNGAANTFTSKQVGTIYTILAEVEGAVAWLSGYDEMHFEICVSPSTLAGVAARLTAASPPLPEGPFMALTDAEQKKLLDDVAWIKSKLTDNLFTPGTAQGQKSVGHTIAATLNQAQSNYNAINKIPR